MGRVGYSRTPPVPLPLLKDCHTTVLKTTMCDSLDCRAQESPRLLSAVLAGTAVRSPCKDYVGHMVFVIHFFLVLIYIYICYMDIYL